VKVGGKPVQATGDLFAAVASLQPGSSVPLTVQRGAKQLDVKVTVGERPKTARTGR
jgi:S1-C subfamily serine protease